MFTWVRREEHLVLLLVGTAITAVVLGLLAAGRANARPVVGAHAPSSVPAGEQIGVQSTPPDQRSPSQRSMPGDTGAGESSQQVLALPAGYSLTDVPDGNDDPNLPDSEPSLGVNFANPNELAIYTFSSDWGGGNAAVWHSIDGGSTWTQRFSVPPPTGVSAAPFCPCDVTLDFDRGGNLFGTFLDVPTQAGESNDAYTGSTPDPTSAAAWDWNEIGGVAQKTDLVNGGANEADQPWLRLNRDPSNASQDNTYVGYDDFTTGAVRISAARGTRPPNFVADNSAGVFFGAINPGTRLAEDRSNGTMYVIWQQSTGANADGSQAIQYIVNRSTDAGQTWQLNGSTTGIIAAAGNSDQPRPKFGTVNALLGGVTTAAVDHDTGDLFYVYGTKDASTGRNRLAIRRLSPNAAGDMTIGPEHFVTGQVNAALPSITVAQNGTIGVLYDTFDGFDANGFPTFTAHLAQSTDHGATFEDVELLTFLSPVTDNGDPRQRILGDYQQLRSVGNTFYGVFSGNRAALGLSPANIDPIFVKAPAKSPNRPPNCMGVKPDATSLWPPNHKFRLITVAGATDPDGDTVTITITGVTQDEPAGGSPDTKPGPKSNQVFLRAERNGNGDGRVYRIAFVASDGKGGTCTGSTVVKVPHDQGKGKPKQKAVKNGKGKPKATR